MRREIATGLLCTVLITFFAASASANNTTAGTAHSIMPNGTAAETFFSGADQQRWYVFRAIVGRSYCAETQGGAFFDTSAGNLDTIVNVVRADQTTSIILNDDTVVEPRSFRLSRACFIAPASELTYVQITPFTGGDTFNYRVRVAESTLFSNWFFVGGDYNAFSLIRNTTSSTLSYTVNWRNLAGTVVATTSSTLSPNATAVLNGRDFAGALGAGNGSVEIAHNGPPDAIFATTTVLSATTGLSFDTIFVKRANW
jgi:hypothetical protein